MKKFDKEEFLKSGIGKDIVNVLHDCKEVLKNENEQKMMQYLAECYIIKVYFMNEYEIDIEIMASSKSGEIVIRNRKNKKILISTKELNGEKEKYKKFVAEEFLETNLGHDVKRLMNSFIIPDTLYPNHTLVRIAIDAIKDIYGINVFFARHRENNQCHLINIDTNEVLIKLEGNNDTGKLI